MDDLSDEIDVIERYVVEDTGERGCGFREPGGVYIVTQLSRKGRPLEDFLLDPPVAVDTILGSDVALPNRGVLVIEDAKRETHHVFDKIGIEHYPNVLDFYYECKRHGLSRRVPANKQLELLNERSLVMLAHPRAIIENAAEYYAAMVDEVVAYKRAAGLCCPKRQKPHVASDLWTSVDRPAGTCAGLWWDDVVGGELSFDPTDPVRTVERGMPTKNPRWWYQARKRPEGIKPEYRAGFFMRLPATKLVVIEDPEGGEHERAMEWARLSSLPVELSET